MNEFDPDLAQQVKRGPAQLPSDPHSTAHPVPGASAAAAWCEARGLVSSVAKGAESESDSERSAIRPHPKAISPPRMKLARSIVRVRDR